MSDDADSLENSEKDEASLDNPELLMYRDYLNYLPIEDIAVKYDMHPQSIYKIAKLNNWKESRLKAKRKAYKNLDKKYQEQLVDIVKFIEHDYKLLMRRCMSENREMHKEERQYVLSLLDKLTKESRLNDGKPTDITDSNHVIRHEVILPIGAKRFGVIPPGPNTTQVEAKEIRVTDTLSTTEKEPDSDDI